MFSSLEFLFVSFTTLFVIVDPIGLIPTYLTMTHGNSVKDKVHMARLASLITLIILLITYFLGIYILKLFSITLPAFEIAGGIILLIVGLDMLQAKRTGVKVTTEEQEEGISKSDIAVTPLAIPMLAGPGAITSVILLSSHATDLLLQSFLVANIVVICALTAVILEMVAKKNPLTVTGMKITTRLMGLILSAMAVQFILNGIKAAEIF